MPDVNFKVKNGLVVNTNLIYANGGMVGINNSSPTANLTVTGNMIVSGNVVFGNTLTVTGAVAFANQLSFSGNGSFTSGISVTGNASFGSAISVTGNSAIGGNETVTGSLAVTSNVTFSNTLSVTGAATFSNTMSVTGNGTFGALYSSAFYDTANTSYFIDPATTSRANTINADLLRSYGGAYATVYYDQDDTAWYLDPNGRSRLSSLTLVSNSWVQSTDGYNRLQFSTNNTTYIAGGNTSQYWIAFGTQDNSSRAIFTGAGDFYTTGNVTAYWSDKRLKKNIERISDWREIVRKLHGYRFEWNDLGKKFVDEEGTQVGLLAQEVKEALPQAAAIQMLQYEDRQGDVFTPRSDINYDPENPYLTVKEEKIIPVLVEAINGLMDDIEALKAEIKLLKGE